MQGGYVEGAARDRGPRERGERIRVIYLRATPIHYAAAKGTADTPRHGDAWPMSQIYATRLAGLLENGFGGRVNKDE
ncbi:hypothetical protein EVAR_10697_1 [Eumeta japonica]|uniref:Uncharacterized protein n=1 Tax=Eumeta variegata TaxID=151549 RepID=A0A4C1U7V4_EUMVA|nr:hypothetical protein EVAR_10697_1 [Eumeta japonica]